jgi:hypothetical protein
MDQEIEKKIAQILELPISQLIFNFKQNDSIVCLDLITINPNHKQSFLFHSVKAIDKNEALEKMLDYILKYHQSEDSYTIQWLKIGDKTLNTSYFRSKNIYGVLDKFYYERDLNSYKIYSISLNPIS